jgi:hypothetical protein
MRAQSWVVLFNTSEPCCQPCARYSALVATAAAQARARLRAAGLAPDSVQWGELLCTDTASAAAQDACWLAGARGLPRLVVVPADARDDGALRDPALALAAQLDAAGVAAWALAAHAASLARVAGPPPSRARLRELPVAELRALGGALGADCAGCARRDEWEAVLARALDFVASGGVGGADAAASSAPNPQRLPRDDEL